MLTIVYVFVYFGKQQGAAAERSRKQQATDHLYALSACPKAIHFENIDGASLRVRQLQQEKSNAMKRGKKGQENYERQHLLTVLSPSEGHQSGRVGHLTGIREF